MQVEQTDDLLLSSFSSAEAAALVALRVLKLAKELPWCVSCKSVVFHSFAYCLVLCAVHRPAALPLPLWQSAHRSCGFASGIK
jgi:hypothetical protein